MSDPSLAKPEMPVQPPDQVLAKLGIRLLTPLGGRLNQHWLVMRGRVQLVLRRWYQPRDEIDYELRLLADLAALGAPVAPALEEPVEFAEHWWSLAPVLPGEPAEDVRSEPRRRGRLLAEFHTSLRQLGGCGQRGNWRRCEEILGDPALDRLLPEREPKQPEEVRLLRWHLDRARERAAPLKLEDRAGMVIHGDFTRWNLHFERERLSGILDFELAHWDHRIGDFALAWRGKYDEVIHGYEEVSPLEPEEWEALTPVWWTGLIHAASQCLAQGARDDGWIVKKLLERSPPMGPDRVAFR
jgi:Ser/Thr protein kinase RdoA (MazF antagonist)